jgi:hypothetical protein
MQVDRLSVAIEADLGRAVREAAAQSGLSLSRWMAEAALDRLRNQLLGVALDAWEAEDGDFTDRELSDAVRQLRLTEAATRHAS